MILYDFSLHLADILKISYSKWGPSVIFGSSFYWGSATYTWFWTCYWGIALIFILVLTGLIIYEKKNITGKSK